MNAVVKVLVKSPRPNVRPDPDYLTLTTVTLTTADYHDQGNASVLCKCSQHHQPLCIACVCTNEA